MNCDICGKTETGRLLEGKAVCDSCFIKGKYNLPENRAKLVAHEVEKTPAPAKPKSARRK